MGKSFFFFGPLQKYQYPVYLHYLQGSAQLPVSAAGLVTVLYWFCVEMMLDLGLSTGEDSRVNSSTILLMRGWFLGSSLRRCSRECRRRSSF